MVVAIALCVFFWCALLVDWWLEPSRNLRILAWLAAGFSLAIVFYRFLWQRLRRPLTDGNIALLVERANPELQDRLLTAVAPIHGSNPSPFLEAIRHEVDQLSTGYSPAAIISYHSLRKRIAIALILLTTIAGFALWQREEFAFWMDRLALSEELWPRRVRLMVEGFESAEDGRLIQNIPRYESAELVVLADLAGSYQVPAEVEVRYRAPDQPEERASLARVGQAVKGRDATQAFRHLFPELREPLQLEIRGGDARLTNLVINVLPRPRISTLQIEANYADYLQMTPRMLSATSVVTVPMGTTLTIVGHASQPLERVETSTTIEGFVPPKVSVDEADPHVFRLVVEKLLATGELSFLPVDTLGVAAREPYVLTLVAQTDELPTVTAQLAGIGTSVTSNARIPLRVRAEDDRAVDRAWVELIVDGQANRAISILTQGDSAVTTETEIDFEVLTAAQTDPLQLQPGQRLSLVARAQDAWDLSDAARIGSSRTIAVDIVPADQLLESLEREEINLRRTFERVIEKAVQCGDTLDKISVNRGDNADEIMQLTRIQLARVVDDVRQVTDESLSVSVGFQFIHDQLVNNRIGDGELKSRLRERIALPLRSLAERELIQLASAIDETARLASPSARDISALRRNTARIVDQMRIVLAEMKSLETYSEVVSMLRKLIQEQEVLTEKTREDQRKQLRTLLEE